MKSKFKRYAWYYCILPNGNASEFPWIDSELIKRKITAYYHDFESGGRIYRIHRKELHKLPMDVIKPHVGEPYLGDDNSGYGIYNLSQAALNSLMTMNPLNRKTEYRWREINGNV